MKGYKPVEISVGSFGFCKYSVAFLLWIALILQSKVLVLVFFIIMVTSALLKVRNAPLVFLYSHTADKIIQSKQAILDENAVWFAHTVGAVVSGTALVFLYCLHPLTGWIVTGVLAILKTSGALGFCGAMKLYGCLNNPNGTCCRAGRKIRNSRCGQ